MVERLKQAIEKAREQRAASTAHGAPAPTVGATVRVTPAAPTGIWASLSECQLSTAQMAHNRIVTHDKSDAAHAGFDVLRTRLLKVCREAGWKRIGITSPTKGCGKSVVCANLAFSIARNVERRAMLIDLDLRAPRIATMLGVRGDRRLAARLRAGAPTTEILERISDNFALALNTVRERDSAETLQSALTIATIKRIVDDLAPDVALFDLPPILGFDDTQGFLHNLDGILLVAAAGTTTAAEIEQCERIVTENTSFLGVLINKVRERDDPSAAYPYED